MVVHALTQERDWVCAIGQQAPLVFLHQREQFQGGEGSIQHHEEERSTAGTWEEFCYKVLLGSLSSSPASVELCWPCSSPAAGCSIGSPGPVQFAASSLDNGFSSEGCEETGFRLMTRSSLFPDSAIRGTTKQQSKSLVRTWFICGTKQAYIQITFSVLRAL